MALTLPLPPQNMPAEVYSYLFQMVQLLNVSVDALSTGATVNVSGGVSGGTSGASGGDMSSNSYEELQSLIIKTAEIVNRKMDELKVELKGSYVAQSEFGTYVEELNAYLVAHPDAISQYYTFASVLDENIKNVETEFNKYTVKTQGYIRTGIVAYEDGVPQIGVAVGQDLLVEEDKVTVNGAEYDVVKENGFRAIFTAKELSFWQDGEKVAYLNNKQLYVTNIVALEKIKLGSWHVGPEDGFFVRWIGGAV